MKAKQLIRFEPMVWAVIGLTLVTACSRNEPAPISPTVAQPDLTAHGAQFEKGIIEVTDGVYVAIGFGLANSILIEGTDGVVIVDTMESAEAALPVKQAFTQISAKPVKAMIYTHFHSDHIGGGRIMAGDDHPEVYSHQEMARHLYQVAALTRETTYRRAMRQFGTLLPEDKWVNAGIGPRLVYDDSKTLAILAPTQTFSGEHLDIEVAGIKMTLMHAPGETPDQIIVWLPEKKVLLPADNYYHAFPNLYAIRGTAYRDVMLWVKSLDRMRALGAQYLVPQHTRPITGASQILETLTNYRDAIQFVHDQTLRGMNQGLSAQAIVERVKLPAHLASQPYLQEYYGTVEWSVRAIFDGYLGWFSGNATDLFPLTQQARAQRMAELAGGEKALLARAQQAVTAGDHQWALELADHLLRLTPEMPEMLRIRATALRALGEKQVAATARNYYLTQSLEAQQKLVIGAMKKIDPETIHNIPLSAFFEGMTVKLDPSKSADVDWVAGFRFPDTGEAYTVHVRRGVAEISARFPEAPDIELSVESAVWKEILTGLRNPAIALAKDVKKEGGVLKIVNFLNLFKEE
jgi:alkyl sulfatase BDS1-like metallo-beta-lactamase superfamily hydrolase